MAQKVNGTRDVPFENQLALLVGKQIIEDTIKYGRSESLVSQADTITNLVEPSLKKLGLTKRDLPDRRRTALREDIKRYFRITKSDAIVTTVLERAERNRGLSGATLSPGAERALCGAAKEQGIEVVAGPRQYKEIEGLIEPPITMLRSGNMVPTGYSYYFCIYREGKVIVSLSDVEIQGPPGWRWDISVLWAEKPKDAALFMQSLANSHQLQLIEERKGRVLSANYEPIALRTWQFEDLAFDASVKEDIEDLVQAFETWQSPACTVPHWGGVLVGPPGTGKTTVGGLLLSKKLPECTVLYLKAADFLNLPHGVNSQFIVRDAFRWAELLAPTLMIVDDIDLIVPHRGSGYFDPITNCFMESLDGLPMQSKLFFVAMTNRPDVVESALLNRPGRMGTRIFFKDARDCFVEILKSQARMLGLAWREEIDAYLESNDVRTVFPKNMVFTADLAANVMRRVALCSQQLTAVSLEKALAATSRAFGESSSARVTAED
ncbi:MAG: ATP-binding protein [Candidatus Pacebacteria bacterium]|nr:ATP-binding protein [Candidatus Paceibacterota bacterium]